MCGRAEPTCHAPGLVNSVNRDFLPSSSGSSSMRLPPLLQLLFFVIIFLFLFLLLHYNFSPFSTSLSFFTFFLLFSQPQPFISYFFRIPSLPPLSKGIHKTWRSGACETEREKELSPFLPIHQRGLHTSLYAPYKPHTFHAGTNLFLGSDLHSPSSHTLPPYPLRTHITSYSLCFHVLFTLSLSIVLTFSLPLPFIFF